MSRTSLTDALLQHLSVAYGATGILLYGSASTVHFSQTSDIDLLCLHSKHRLRSVTARWEATDLDIILGSYEALSNAVFDRPDGNNAFILRALATGSVLTDEHGELNRLIGSARSVWNNGPPVINRRERELIINRATKIAASVQRWKTKYDADLMQESLAETQCAIFLGMLIRDYCKVMRIWSSSLKSLLLLEEVQYYELQEILRHFLRSSTLIERLGIVAYFAQVTISHLAVSA